MMAAAAVPWSSTVATHDDWEEIGASVASSRWQELLDQLAPSPSAAADTVAGADADGPTLLSVLVVKQDFYDNFAAIAEQAHARLGGNLVVVLAAGVIGGGEEVESSPGMSLLTGSLPRETTASALILGRGVSTKEQASTIAEGAFSVDAGEANPPAFLVWADPLSTVEQVVNGLDLAFPLSVVAGALSCPIGQNEPSLAWYSKDGGGVLEVGSTLALALKGPNLEVHSVTAQGGHGVGPTFLVTKGEGNVVAELAGKPALNALSEVMEKEEDARVRSLLSSQLLCGFPSRLVEKGNKSDQITARDFLIRQVSVGQWQLATTQYEGCLPCELRGSIASAPRHATPRHATPHDFRQYLYEVTLARHPRA